VIAGVALTATTGEAAASAPVVLVRTQTPITAIDANSTWLGLRRDRRTLTAAPGCVTVINRRRWTTGAITNVFRCNQDGQQEDSAGFALRRSATTWITGLFQSQGCCDLEEAMSLRTPTGGVRDSSFHHEGCGGNELVNLVARADAAAYTKAIWTTSSCPGNPTTGTDSLTGGEVRTLRLPTGRPRALPGSPPARFIGVSRRHLALVPYDLTTGVVNRYPPPLPEIEVWGLRGRKLQRTIAESGVITAMALYGDQIAVLVESGSGNRRIDRFSATTGAGTGSTPVARTTAPMLAVYYRWVVYVVGNEVKALNSHNESFHMIAISGARPRQVLAVRGKAVWFTTTENRSRVLAASLP
jgi:hypothetical protein